ncbi:MAG: hypothetical protein KGY65_07110 [Candidatus Thermoplasmatota archaeon]|nr:hypothetical protein [Candidatus Thermoplasmatota archaeon]
MVNDDQYTPIKLRNEIIAEIDKIKDADPFLQTRPDVLKFILHRYVEEQKNIQNGGKSNGGSNIQNSHLSTKKQKNGEDEKNV